MKPFLFFILLAIGIFTQSCVSTDIAQRNARFQDSCVAAFNGQKYEIAMLPDGTTGPSLCEFKFSKNGDGNIFIYTDETPFELFGQFEIDQDGQVCFTGQGLRWVFGFESVTRLKQHTPYPQKIYVKGAPEGVLHRYIYAYETYSQAGRWLRMFDIYENKVVFYERGFSTTFQNTVLVEKLSNASVDTLICSNDQVFIMLLENEARVEFINHPEDRMHFTK